MYPDLKISIPDLNIRYPDISSQNCQVGSKDPGTDLGIWVQILGSGYRSLDLGTDLGIWVQILGSDQDLGTNFQNFGSIFLNLYFLVKKKSFLTKVVGNKELIK